MLDKAWVIRNIKKELRSGMICLMAGLVSALLLVFISNLGTRRAEQATLVLPDFDQPVSLVQPVVMSYLQEEEHTEAKALLLEARKQGRQDIGGILSFTFDVVGLDREQTVRESIIALSENPDFSDARVFRLRGDLTGTDMNLLKVHTKYYYQVTVELSDDTVLSADGTFETADTPRILTVDGICNVRDIGGWDVGNGMQIKQGLLYRGTELDGAVEPTYCVTSAGIGDMLTVLGIRMDMDLRASTDNLYQTEPLGGYAKHTYYNAPMYTGIFDAANQYAIQAIFADLADPDHYPVYLHCTYGLDRTGTMCCLLEALLGVSEEDLVREYQLSMLWHYGCSTGELLEMLNTLNKDYPGDTLQEQAENFLLGCGVTQEEIVCIREIFLEDANERTDA